MAKENKQKIDFDSMSDKEFAELDEEQFSGNVPENETTLSNNETEDGSIQISNENSSRTADSTDAFSDNDKSDKSGNDFDSGSPEQKENQEENTETGPVANGTAGENEQTFEDNELQNNQQFETDSEKEKEIDFETDTKSENKEIEETDEEVKKGKAETPAKAGYYRLPDDMDTAAVDYALNFYKKITTPFKADGRDFSVRSPEDAIRLMQQGVNYSRRMQEIKPIKALNRMLTDHELNDPEKLNFLIDLSKGDKAAIIQLLKNHNIDPMDLDIEKDSGYQANDYQGNPQDNDFRDALDMALTTPEGQALVSHIHKDWDAASKARLREDPSIIGTLQSLMVSGVYDKVVEELRYQQSLGYLQGTPFLQAFDQVGEAMKKAGIFDSPNPATGGSSMAPIRNQPQNTPVAMGGRKQNSGLKKPAANPHLSSTPPSKQSGNTKSVPVDFDKMSDEEFARLVPPE